MEQDVPSLRATTRIRRTTILPSASSLQLDKLQKLIEQSLDDDKAEEIVSIDLSGKSSFADVMVVASGRSQRHIASIADHLEHKLKSLGLRHVMVEGKEVSDWVLVDAGDIVIHIFKPEVRSLYNLEKMWSVEAAAPKVLEAAV